MRKPSFKFIQLEQIRKLESWTAELQAIEANEPKPIMYEKHFGICYFDGRFTFAILPVLNPVQDGNGWNQGYAWVKFVDSDGYELFWVRADNRNPLQFLLSI